MSPNTPPKTPHEPAARAAPLRNSGGIDRWEDEGGPVSPRRRLALKRDQRDTAAGCRERAASDLLEAATLSTVNGRARMESSAATWTVRADLLDRLEASFEARQALKARGGDPNADPKLRI